MKNEATLQNLSDFDNKSLIIVDDDNPFRDRLSRAMEKKGFEVLQAESVKKGIDTVKVKKPGFAVIDLRLAERLEKATGEKLPLIIAILGIICFIIIVIERLEKNTDG